MKRAAVTLLLLALFSLPAQAWKKDCQPRKCRVYTFIDVIWHKDGEPIRLLLEVTDKRKILITALSTRANHNKFFTNNPPTSIALGGKEYVLSLDYFNDSFSAILMVDGSKVGQLNPPNTSQVVLEQAAVDNAIAAFKAGITATVKYKSILHAAKPARFTLIGFTKAFRSLPQSTSSVRKTSAQSVNPLSVVKPAIDHPNSFSVSVKDLRKRANPFGIGSFVFVPKTRYAGVERLFIWFVRGDEAVKLNGATHNLTPSLPFPNDTAPDFWENTGLSATDVTRRGIDLVFNSPSGSAKNGDREAVPTTGAPSEDRWRGPRIFDIVLVLLVLGMVTAVIVRRRKKRDGGALQSSALKVKKETLAEAGMPFKSTDQGMKNAFWVLIIIIGLLAINAMVREPTTTPKKKVEKEKIIVGAEFRTMRACIESIKRSSGQTLDITTDKPTKVSGNLSNGELFFCRRESTGTKGTYYQGGYSKTIWHTTK